MEPWDIDTLPPTAIRRRKRTSAPRPLVCRHCNKPIAAKTQYGYICGPCRREQNKPDPKAKLRAQRRWNAKRGRERASPLFVIAKTAAIVVEAPTPDNLNALRDLLEKRGFL